MVSTHYHKYDTDNSQRRTLDYRDKRDYFEHSTTIMAVSHIIMSIANQLINLRQRILKVTEQFMDIRQQILTMTANSQQHRSNNNCFLGVWHAIFDQPEIQSATGFWIVNFKNSPTFIVAELTKKRVPNGAIYINMNIFA